jgi:nucleotide-binding universal stress UspA family protein
MRILIPVDGSRHAQAAVEFVARRVLRFEASADVVLLNVQPRVSGEVERLIGAERLGGIREKDAREILDPALAQLQEAGVAARSEIRVGGAGEHIAELGDHGETDLIVMGARGLSEFQGLFLGSETSKVLAACTTPLVVVRDTRLPEPGAPRRIGIAVDGSSYGKAAVRYVLDHLPLFGDDPRFTLIHAVTDYAAPAAADLATPLAMYSSDEIAKVQARTFDAALAGARAAFAARGVPFAEAKLIGAPAEEIAKYARHNQLDLLVLGSHGNGRFMSAVLGSVAMRVAAHCQLPLLLVRRP